LQNVTRTVPIVFVSVTDPVGAGYVASLSRPGGNTTGGYLVRIRHEREMAGTAQGKRARPDAGSGRSRPLHNVWNRPVRRNPGCGPVTPSGVDADRCARR